MDTVRRFAVLLSAVAILFAAARPALAWREIHPGVANEASECVSWSPGRIDCFSRTLSGSLSWVYFEGGKWSAPHDLGGKLAAAPSCVVRGPGGINCFATSAKGLLATIHLNGNKWSKWASLGGELKASRVACVAHARDRIVCFARGRGDRLMTRKWSGAKTWEPWRDLGGALSADPECIVVGAAGAACFGRGAAGELVAFLPDAAGKSGGWTTLGGRIEGRPSCVRLKSGEAACAAQSVAGRLHLWRGMPVFAENAGATTSLDDVVTAEPACALENATLVCLTRDNRRRLVRRSLGAAVDTTRDGVIDAPQAVALACLSLGPDGFGCVLTDAERKLRFARGQDLAAAPANPASAAAGQPTEGLWYLSNRRTGSTCRVLLASDLAFGAKRLRAGPRCRRFVGLPARPAQWDRLEQGLVFLAADGRVLIRFMAAPAGRWTSSQSETSGFLLTREPPGEVDDEATEDTAVSLAPVAAPSETGRTPMAEMYGAWRVFTDAGVLQLCTIGLTDAPAGDGYAVQTDPSCGDRFAGVRYWTGEGPALTLVGANNAVLARFDSAGPGEWRSAALGGVVLKR
jgi:hypothetical protein